jgi:predicted AlkP superfamily phosphohydrolase/phosphomutase
MSSYAGPRVLAIGIDAAESSLVRQLITLGQMPALSSLLKDGRWLTVDSPAAIGSGSVWPTLMSGADPTTHGVYSEWSWRPESMTLTRFDGATITPFWKSLAERDVAVGIFDVPFALPIGVARGYEVCEWWAHDTTGFGLQVHPIEFAPAVKRSAAHPLSKTRFINTTPDTQWNLDELTAACVEGARLRTELVERLVTEGRPELSFLVFPEIHRASHHMWHTADPGHSFYPRRQNGATPAPLLQQVYRAVDEEIGKLVKGAAADATILVFALHGMRAGLGFPTFLTPLLCERGFSSVESLASQSWRKRLASSLAAAKRHTPDAFKQLYYKTAPRSATHKLARPFMWPIYDWKKTRAFSLPTDQHGWIRVNLKQREAEGIVAPEDYQTTCIELENMLRALVREDGLPLVHKIIRTSEDVEKALTNPLPDIVVHWADAAFASPLKITGSAVQAQSVGAKFTGQHASEGFCIYRGAAETGDTITAKDLAQLMTDSLGARASRPQ